jgi:membrane-associated phospholipid phosphatase
MFANTIENWVSAMAMVYVGIPIFLFVTFQNLQALKLTGIVLTANGLTDLIKFLTRDSKTPFLKRPAAAEGCNLAMTGKQGGAPGFPSGHMATTTAFWTAVFFVVQGPYRQYILYGGIISTVLMMWSRMKKSCHTFLQCVMGGCLGFGIAYVGKQYLL